ncbi:MAG: MoaD/ThiS family protein [Candidatus Odinarchaeota archaeon]
MPDLLLKFLSTLKEVTGVPEIRLSPPMKLKIGELLDLLELKGVKIKGHIQTSGSNVYSASMLILVNDLEISVLKGLETELKDGDVITFIPVVHGG